MSTASRPRLMTAEEFMDADLGDGLFELVRGEVVRLSPPFYPHGSVCYHLAGMFGDYERRTRYGHGATNDTSIQTTRAPDSVRGPDVLFYSNARWPRSATDVKLPPVPPDVAVEVRSPGDRRREIEAKVAEYLQAGVLVVWVVDPRKRTVSIHRAGTAAVALTDKDVIADQPELPDFRASVAEILDGWT